MTPITYTIVSMGVTLRVATFGIKLGMWLLADTIEVCGSKAILVR